MSIRVSRVRKQVELAAIDGKRSFRISFYAALMLRIALLAPLAGLMGSITGVAALALVTPTNPGHNQPEVFLFGTLVVFLVSLLVTVPACLLIGSPLIYVFRTQLQSAPWRWALLITFLGMILGTVCFGWAVTSHTSPQGLELVLLFSATSAMSFALLYGLSAHRRAKVSSVVS